MDWRKISEKMRGITKKVARKSPVILTGVGIAGMYTGAIMAVKATPKALAILDIHREREDQGLEEPLTKTEIVKLTWKCYIPAAITACISTACLIGANTVNGKQKAALATAYALSETALREYKDKIIEVVGEEKASQIREVVAQETLRKNPVSDKEVFITSRGEHLCFEPLSGRYFKSDADAIQKSVNELNRRMQTEMCISLNDYFTELGLKEIEGCVGDDCGWNIEKGLIDISFSASIAEDGTPCLVLNYLEPPYYGYYIS